MSVLHPYIDFMLLNAVHKWNTGHIIVMNKIKQHRNYLPVVWQNYSNLPLVMPVLLLPHFLQIHAVIQRQD